MWKSVKTPLITTACIFACLLIYTKLFGPIPFSVNSVTTTKSNLFTVQGTGDATGIPDTAQLTIGVNKTALTVQQAQEQANTIINNVTNAMKQLGVQAKDIKTTNYSVTPNYDYSSGSQAINGYAVNAEIQVNLKSVDKANQAIDAATRAGATNVGNVQFVLNDDKKKELENQARKEAIEAAKAKAQSIAQASGIHIGRLIDVQETADNTQPRPLDFQAAAKVATPESAPTQLTPGENKVTSNITLSYETY